MKAEELGSLVAVIPGDNGTEVTAIVQDARITEDGETRIIETGLDFRVIE